MKKDKEIKVTYPTNNFLTRFLKKLFKIPIFELTASYPESLRLELKEKHGINLKREVRMALKAEYDERMNTEREYEEII